MIKKRKKMKRKKKKKKHPKKIDDPNLQAERSNSIILPLF